MKIDQLDEKINIGFKISLIYLMAKHLFKTKDNYEMNEQIKEIRELIDELIVSLNRLESTIKTEGTKCD